MRRIVSACLLQTMRFDTSKDANPEKDFEIFCNKLDKNRTRYKIEDKKKEADGSIVVKIRKQYNTYQAEGYLD